MTDDIVIGVDLGGTHFQVGAVSEHGEILARARGETPDGGAFRAIVEALAQTVRKVCDELQTRPDRLLGVGVGAAGVVVPETGVVIQAGVLPWNNEPFGEELAAHLDGARVVVDNDVNAAAVGEHRMGAGHGAPDMLAVWIGTGIGAGLILGGRLHRGTYFSAGELGLVVPDPGRPEGERTLQDRASRSRMAAALAKAKGEDAEGMTSRRVAELYNAGDSDARRIIDEGAALIGVAVANAITLLSLGRVVMGGGIVESMGEALIGPIAETARRYVFPDECRRTPFVPTALCDNAGLLGASIIARDTLTGEG